MLRCLLFCLSLLSSPALAQCQGQNVLETLDPATRATVVAAAAAQPFATGNFWRATRAGQVLYLIGTYHLADARHDPVIKAVSPLLAEANTLLVEAGPEQEAALKDYLARNPDKFVAPGLVDRLDPEVWVQLANALRARGVPPALGAQLRPWYLALMLSLPPCAMAAAAQGDGLDNRLIALARDKGLTLTALEPFDTALRLFDDIPEDEQIDMIRNALLLEPQAEDFLATMADAYFAQDSRLIWELNRVVTKSLPGADATKIDHDFTVMEAALMANRNRAWIAVLEEAATNGPALAAFGALHLSGQGGVLALLQANGWALQNLPLAAP